MEAHTSSVEEKMTKIYQIMNRRDTATDARLCIPFDDSSQRDKPKVWCINFRNMEIVQGRLVGIDGRCEHVVVLEDDDVAEGTAWAVPKDNVYYDKHSAEKGLFKAHLKYERDFI